MLPFRYYLENTGGNVTTVLKDAGIVDVDAMLAQVTGGTLDSVMGDLDTYTFR